MEDLQEKVFISFHHRIFTCKRYSTGVPGSWKQVFSVFMYYTEMYGDGTLCIKYFWCLTNHVHRTFQVQKGFCNWKRAGVVFCEDFSSVSSYLQYLTCLLFKLSATDPLLLSVPGCASHYDNTILCTACSI